MKIYRINLAFIRLLNHLSGKIVWVADYAISPKNMVNYAITPTNRPFTPLSKKELTNYATDIETVDEISNSGVLHLKLKEVSFFKTKYPFKY